MLLLHVRHTIQFAFYSIDGEFEEGTKGESVLKTSTGRNPGPYILETKEELRGRSWAQGKKTHSL